MLPTTNMSSFSDFYTAGRNVPSRVLYLVFLVLLSYILLGFAVYHSGKPQFARSALNAFVEPKGLDICSTLMAHSATLPARIGHDNPDPWSQMKWIGVPAYCKVRGHLIEGLDEVTNFRRGFALKFVNDVEDKTHLLPWLYGSKENLNARQRRVFLDLGANKLNTSVQWFMRMYPCDFTEVHAFEAIPDLFRSPEQGADGTLNTEGMPLRGHSAVEVKSKPGISDWMLKRMKVYDHFVADYDDRQTNRINITRFVKEELHLKASDAVVVKMDIEGAEWLILRRWLGDPAMAEIIDELFVEIHYNHTSMFPYHWAKFNYSRWEARDLIARLRWKGFFVHAWP